MTIHPTAQVSSEAKIDPSVEIGPWCTVGPNVKIGKGSKLLSHVIIDGWTDIGENNMFHPFAVVGGTPQDLKYNGENTRVQIGNNNIIRESVTINLGTAQDRGVTEVGNGCLIMAYCHLGHDSLLHDNVILSNSVGLAGHAEIEEYAILCGQTGVSQFVKVGAFSYIGGQSGLEKSVPPFTIAYGSRPCVVKGTNIVGLKRRGFAVEVIQKINEAVKLWIRKDVPKEQCLLEIESQYGDVREIERFVRFIRTSEAGVVRS